MEGIGPEKCVRLIFRTSSLVKDMDQTKDMVVHRRINQFYYMQKNEELRLLIQMLNEPGADRAIISSFMTSKYREVFLEWCKDIRWLRNYLKHQGLTNL